MENAEYTQLTYIHMLVNLLVAHCNAVNMIYLSTVVYKETLPCDAPPTYRGQLLKYAYKITIGTQRLGSPTKLLRIPIMVIVLQGN